MKFLMNRFAFLSSLVAVPFALFAGTLQTVTLEVKNMTCFAQEVRASKVPKLTFDMEPSLARFFTPISRIVSPHFIPRSLTRMCAIQRTCSTASFTTNLISESRNTTSTPLDLLTTCSQ